MGDVSNANRSNCNRGDINMTFKKDFERICEEGNDCNIIRKEVIKVFKKRVSDAKRELINWLSNLIDTSKKCLLDKKPSEEYNKLMFQLEFKLKELKKELQSVNGCELSKKK